ncbi:trafficking protein particle complex subunit 8 [Belonocnema kinseyi]|uniref:trafficking protein particle complex subunit 8 n=1 Tax=Belonocnema kinseyi TaxID=2817044 RepID=UPI00143D9C7A|nr:trafficking protein particle complex subunit 8 [Belonocnema kinseyi]
MAQCKLTPREFIVNTFSPQVAAVCSNNAEATCQKNNLSFIELLQPFCRLNSEGHIKDPQGSTVAVRSLQISVRDVNATPPEPSLARKMLNETVSSSFTERTTVVHTGSIDLNIPVSIPWFEAWRETFLNVQYPSDHEFTKHFLACMIVVSTSDDDPLETIQQMATKLNQTIPGKLPKWFNNNVLRYYILIHDAHQDNKKKAEDVFKEMKNVYGTNNCFLLQMNSRPPGQTDDNSHLPDPWSQFIVKNVSLTGGSDQNSSPRTPADTTGVSSMPNQVNTEHEKTSHAGTPMTPQAATFSTADFADAISISSEVSEPTVQLEVGQEAVPTTIHPLSPLSETAGNFVVEDSKMHLDNSPINANVWADSPGHSATQHGTRLSSDDMERLRTMISEFCFKSLLPYVERQIGLLNDVISNKKGVSRSLFSATKRWFGTSKPGVPGSIPANVVIYTAESPELQLRRLGDLCFMFGHYVLAYQAYHNAKRDFAADQAWLYYAGALEMAALSAFMQDEMTRKSIEYMDDAILTYLNTCKMPQFATRATLLSAECLKNRGLYADAAKQYIRMTSEDSDLRSALLLEQAAYCFIGPKMVRKYAFHAVIAGHRFSKAGQKKHSLRCYQQAYQVYRDKGWSFAEDHIHFTLGRQAASLKQTKDAVKVFEKLLNPYSRQPALQQAAFLREFLHISNVLYQESKPEERILPILPLPLIDGNQIKVLPGPLLKLGDNLELVAQISSFLQDADDTRWSKLEERVVTKAQGSVPMIFKPSISIYSDLSNNSSRPNAVLDEPIYLSIQLSNPLQISLPLSQITLLWSFEIEGAVFSNESSVSKFATLDNSSNLVETETIETILLQPSSKQDLVLHLKPKVVGSLKILGLSYKLSTCSDFNPPSSDQSLSPNSSLGVHGKRLFEVKGPKLKNVKEKPEAILYGIDQRLEINVLQKAPFMDILYTKLSPEMLCGEMQRVEVTLRNIGNAPLNNVHVGSTNPRLISFLDHKGDTNSGKSKIKFDTLVTRIALGSLKIGESYSTVFWVRAPHEKGNHRLDLLFYYENPELKTSPSKYRVSRHSWHLTVLDSIQISAVVRASAVCSEQSPTMNLTVRVKNMNQVHDPFINEIQLINVAFQSKNWTLINSALFPTNLGRVQPQETAHILLKLKRHLKLDSEKNLECFKDISLEPILKAIVKTDVADILKKELYSSVSLIENDNMESVTNSPYLDFIEKRDISLETLESASEQPSKKRLEENSVSVTMNLDSTLILRWRARVMERGAVVREAVGQHHLDVKILNKRYNQPVEVKQEPIEYGARLKIFGPDANVDARTPLKIDRCSEADCQKNTICYSLDHVKRASHDFRRNRICTIPVEMLMQNNSQSRVDVKVNTIGTTSQTHLPSIKSQLYTPQASTFYRYAGHTAVECHIEPFGCRTLKLQAIIPASGTYDLASRIDVSVRLISRGEFMPQKWHIESVCVVSNENS